MPEKMLALSEKVHGKLGETAEINDVGKEALGNALLMLALCDESRVDQVVNLIENWNLGGASKLESKGL